MPPLPATSQLPVIPPIAPIQPFSPMPQLPPITQSLPMPPMLPLPTMSQLPAVPPIPQISPMQPFPPMPQLPSIPQSLPMPQLPPMPPMLPLPATSQLPAMPPISLMQPLPTMPQLPPIPKSQPMPQLPPLPKMPPIPNNSTKTKHELPKDLNKIGDLKKRRQNRYLKSPGAPKQPLSSFVHFLNERREVLRKDFPDMSFKEISKKLANQWSQIGQEEKQKYVEKAGLDKERYSEELKCSENESIENLVKKRKNECKYCLGIFNKRSITKHEVKCELFQKLKLNEKQCSICKKSFATKQACNQHIGTNHKEALMKLSESAKNANGDPELAMPLPPSKKSNINDNEPYKPYEPYEHTATIHKGKNPNQCFNEQISHVHGGKKPFKCVLCENEFTYKKELHQHKKYVHEEKTATHHCQIFKCAMCDSEFGKKKILNDHIINVHDRKIPFKCDLCESSFASKKNLHRHKKIVHKENAVTHLCQICNKEFSEKHGLKIHNAIAHEKIKPFQWSPFLCNFCGSSFGVKSKLNLHIQAVHEGPKSFQCHLCDSKFLFQKTMSMHMKVHYVQMSKKFSTREKP